MDALTTLARVPRRPTRADVTLTAVLFAWALLEAATAAGPGAWWQRALFAAGVTLPLLVRRRAPTAVVVALVAVLMVRVFAVPGVEESTFPFPSMLVAVFSAALHARRPVVAVAGGVVTLAAMLSLYPLGYYETDTPGQLFILAFFIAGAWTGGWLVRLRAAQAATAHREARARAEDADTARREAKAQAEDADTARREARARAEDAETARREAEARAAEAEAARREARIRAAEAVAAERERIARELHDVVAHSLSIVAVQAGAAEELMAIDPDLARRHVAAARRTAREALTEMRHVLDVQRVDAVDAASALAPQPTLERVADLVDEVRAAGLPVTLAVGGARGDVAPGLDLAGFRIVQEALTNVRRHAGPAATTVHIGYTARWIDVAVRNAAPAPGHHHHQGPPGSGRGLIGMQERARLYGGTVTAGPDGEGFAVEARLPRGSA
ncbi:histidine kinase [Dactylosporangium sp. NPDC049742]|uniref:sensor histidine kinase n=1 Tax=Dactylosporangium sp. NPDC049742 TaxID=3154737 RepID=UPI00341D0773